MLHLRPYQERAVEGIRKAYRSGKRAPLLVLPTGGGKTVVFCHIAAATVANGKRVLILVHRVELLRQTGRALNKSGVWHGLVNPQFTPDYTAPVQVASVQTLRNRLDKMPAPDLIIVDEAHHATAGTWRTIINHFPNAFVLGVTATPVRGDGKGLGVDSGGIFDTIVTGPQVPELIELGFLVKPLVYAPKEKIDLSDVRTIMGDYDRLQIESKMDKPTVTGDAVTHYQRLCPGAPAVAFCISVRHAEHVAQQFRDAGYRAHAVDGSMDDDTRVRLLNGLGNGTVDLIASCDLISEGTDIPAIGCAILLRPTQSLGLYIQQVGRALRPCAGKEFAYILDHASNVITHGMPTEEREWSLDGEIKTKRKSKKKDVKDVKVSQCPKCYSVHEKLPKCPQCGHEYVADPRKLNTVDGELTELTAEQAEKLRRRKQMNSEAGRAKSLEELTELGRKRGFKRPAEWARHVLEGRLKKQAQYNSNWRS